MSRNIALENLYEYCLFADDDIVYKKDFYKTIINAFQENFNADIITFMMEDKQGNLFKNIQIFIIIMNVVLGRSILLLLFL